MKSSNAPLEEYPEEEQQKPKNSWKVKRLCQKIERKNQIWSLYHQKLSYLKEQKIIGLPIDEQFRIEQLIKELASKCNQIEQELQDLEDQLSIIEGRPTVKKYLHGGIVQIILGGNIEELDRLTREKLILSLSGVLGIKKHVIQILYTKEGSTKVIFQMPMNSAIRLASSFQKNHKSLQDFIEQFSVKDIKIITSMNDYMSFGARFLRSLRRVLRIVPKSNKDE